MMVCLLKLFDCLSVLAFDFMAGVGLLLVCLDCVQLDVVILVGSILLNVIYGLLLVGWIC